MADDATLEVGIGVDTGSSTKETKELANALATIGTALSDLAAGAKTAMAAVDKVERNLAGVGKGAKQARQELADLNKEAAKSAGALATAYTRQHAKTLPMSREAESRSASEYARQHAAGLAPSPAMLQQQLQAYRAQREEQQRQVKILQDQLSIHAQIYKQQNNAAQQAKRNAVNQQTGLGIGGMSLNTAAGNNNSWARQRQEQVNTIASLNQQIADGHVRLESYNDRLANTRYALYGLTNALAIAGTALAAMNIGIVKVAADMQTMFASIERTSGTSGSELRRLEEDFISLGQTIPSSFKDIGAVATLAGQLNVPSQNIARFTELVTQFTATTNVTVESAATAFGRLDALLPDVQGNYEALGSSILNVGVNSVATEQEIIATTTQIAAAGAQAGFTADQIIGLSASFASLGVAPESARGTVIRTLTTIRSAVSAGGVDLEKFAALAGTTADQFRDAWSQDSGGAFLQVLEGLQKEGAGAEDAIRSLGITAVRDLRGLLALSQNVEIVADNLGYAADGFNEATQLGDAFAIIAETLNARLQMLFNSLQSLFAAMGSSGLGAVTEIVTGLNEFVIVLTEIAKNPAAQAIFAVTGAITALSAIVLLASSGVGRTIAAMLAGRPVMHMFKTQMEIIRLQIERTAVASNAAGVGISNMARAKVVASAAATTLARTMGPLILSMVAVAGIGMIWDSVAKSMRSASDVAKESIGDFSGLASALQKDTEELGENAEGYQTVAGQITYTRERTTEWAKTLESTTGHQTKLADATETVTDRVDKLNWTIGQNSQKWIASALASSDAAKDFVNAAKEIGQGALIDEYFDALIAGDTKRAEELRASLLASVELTGSMAGTLDGIPVSLGAVDRALESMKTLQQEVDGSLQEGAAQLEVNEALHRANAGAINLGSDALDEFGSSADDAKNRMDELRNSVSNAFASENVLGQFTDDFYALVEGVATDGPNAFNFMEQGGKANLDNLQTSIASTIYSAEVMGIDATQAVAALFMELQRMGVDTKTLLGSLSGVSFGGGVTTSGIGEYLSGTKQMSGQTELLAQGMSRLRAEADRAATSTKRTGGAAKSAAKEIRTLKDYANDLSNVMSRAFDIRFGSEAAFDKIAAGWRNIAEATEKANIAFRDAQVNMQKLSSQRDDAVYFLGVAEDYKDTLRANELRAEIAELDAKIADEKANAKAATDSQSKALTGNSKSAADNRSTLTGLVSEYQDYLTQLAASGMSQADLQAKSAQLRSEFITQATQMGFNRAEVEKYAVSFDDMSLAISRVPRNITVTANTNPALQALAEFETAARRAGSNAGSGMAAGMGAGMAKVGRGFQLQAQIASIMETIERHRKLGNFSGLGEFIRMKEAELVSLTNRLAAGSYKTGGYTGDGGTSNVAGVVHGKEFVVDAANTARLGLPYLNAINNGHTPAVPVASGSREVIAYLSPEDRRLLAAAGNTALYIDGKQVASATNNANGVQSHRGHK